MNKRKMSKERLAGLIKLFGDDLGILCDALHDLRLADEIIDEMLVDLAEKSNQFHDAKAEVERLRVELVVISKRGCCSAGCDNIAQAALAKR